MKPIVVHWLDAEDSPDTWSDQAEIEKFGEQTMEVVSVGWEVKRTKLYITLAGDQAVDGTFGRVCKIPISMIQLIEEISP